FRAVGGSNNKRSGGPQTRHRHCVLTRGVASVEQAADLAAQAARGDRGLDGNGQTEQRPSLVVAAPGLVEAGSDTDALGIEVDQSIQLRIQALDLADVRFGEFNNGDRTAAQQLQLTDGRLEHQAVHRDSLRDGRWTQLTPLLRLIASPPGALRGRSPRTASRASGDSRSDRNEPDRRSRNECSS